MSYTKLLENMRTTTAAFLDSFNGDWAADAAAHCRSEERGHTLLPACLDRTQTDKHEWPDYFNSICHLIKDAKMTIDDYIPSPDNYRAIVRSSMKATTPVGPYTSEYVWFFTFDESGEKIVDITKFMDSRAAIDLLAKFKEANLL